MSYLSKMSFGVAAAAVMACSSVFADAANALIAFSTPGPDTYADGTKVLDGEWYALVWSSDGNFDGINIDGTPVDANDAVVIMAPLAKKGRCPYTIFQIDSKSPNYKTTGTYSVYLLDTRVAAADGTMVAAKRDATTGKPAMLNGAVAQTTFTSSSVNGSASVAKASTGSATWAAAAITGEVKNPKISGITVEGAKVTITVDDMMPGVQYNVKVGSDPANLDTFGLTAPQTADNAEFIIDQKDAKFFQVVRQPLTTEEK